MWTTSSSNSLSLAVDLPQWVLSQRATSSTLRFGLRKPIKLRQRTFIYGLAIQGATRMKWDWPSLAIHPALESGMHAGGRFQALGGCWHRIPNLSMEVWEKPAIVPAIRGQALQNITWSSVLEIFGGRLETKREKAVVDFFSRQGRGSALGSTLSYWKGYVYQLAIRGRRYRYDSLLSSSITGIRFYISQFIHSWTSILNSMISELTFTRIKYNTHPYTLNISSLIGSIGNKWWTRDLLSNSCEKNLLIK